MANRVAMNADFPAIERSELLCQRAHGLIPALTQTLAKGPGQWVRGVAPKYLQRGSGGHAANGRTSPCSIESIRIMRSLRPSWRKREFPSPSKTWT